MKTRRSLQTRLLKMAIDRGNVTTNITNVGKAATKFAVGNDMAKDLADTFTGMELIGPISFMISLITRGIGAVLRLKANCQVLSNLHESFNTVPDNVSASSLAQCKLALCE